MLRYVIHLLNIGLNLNWDQHRQALEQQDVNTEAGIFSIPMPTTNQIQSYRDNNLAAVSNGEKVGGEADHLAFKGSWSRFWIDMWLGWALPKAMTWLRENDPKKNGAVHGNADDDGSDDSDSKYPWVLLVHEQTKLIKFKKKGLITGDDLYTVKHPRGKHWVNQTVYLGE